MTVRCITVPPQKKIPIRLALYKQTAFGISNGRDASLPLPPHRALLQKMSIHINIRHYPDLIYMGWRCGATAP